MRDGWRRIVEDLCVLSALALLSASQFDKTEIRLVTAFGAYLAGRELSAQLPRRKLGYSWPEIAAAAILVLCVAVKCGHELVSRYWVSVAWQPGETNRQWFERTALIAAEGAKR